ncbi:MAG: hypothetical protein ACRDD8_02920 [Bacteroidales bacterium]
MAWLVVNKDGTEYAFSLKPIRIIDPKKYNACIVNGVLEVNCIKEEKEYWGVDHDNYDFEIMNCKFVNRVKLPKDSIEKLIGRQLTWECEPVEIK